VTVARCVVNRHLHHEEVPTSAGPEVLRFHEGLPGYQPTPLRALDDVRWGAVHVKDESDRFGLPAFKILGASWAVERALVAEPTTALLVAASAGNHGRAVARAAAQRRVACRILLPSSISHARAALIADEGAQVTRVDGSYDAAVAAARRVADARGATLIADTGTTATASWVIDGYTTLFREAAAQATAPFDVVIVPIGVGSLAASAVRFAVHQWPDVAVIGVEPVAAACVTASLQAGAAVTVRTPGTSMTGMDCATPSPAAWPVLRTGLTGVITISDDEAHQAMRDLADQGVVAGDCGAATVAALHALRDDARCRGMCDAARYDRSARVLCVNTEGATDPVAYARIVDRR
jgi:diaminopropionate ammonia-lyase